MLVRSLFFSVFLVLVSSPLFSQIQKGAIIQSGGFDLFYGISSGVGPDGNSSSYGGNLSYGLLYLLSDHWAVGGGTQPSGGGIPLVRYYFNPKATTLNWFAGTGTGFDFSRGEQIKMHLSLGAGFNHLLNESVMLEVGSNITFRDFSRQLFSSPEWNLGAGLQLYLSPEGRKNKKSVVPALGRGSWMVGVGEANLTYRKFNDGVYFDLNLLPTVGYFVTDRWMVGLSLQSSYTRGRTSSDFPTESMSDYSRWGLGMDALTRYYIGSTEKRLRPFALAQVGFHRDAFRYFQGTQPPVDSDTNAWLITTRAGFGANLFLSSHVALEASLAYSLLNERMLDPDRTTLTENRIGLNVGFQFFLGGAKE